MQLGVRLDAEKFKKAFEDAQKTNQTLAEGGRKDDDDTLDTEDKKDDKKEDKK